MDYTRENAASILEEERVKYEKFRAMNLKLNMSRGKPSTEQLDLSNGLMDCLSSKSSFIGSQDYRNYGLLDGIPETKKLFADLCGVAENEIAIMGNSSLNIMYDTLQRGMQFGVLDNPPMNEQGKKKWLCPAPGYDRHFAITELFGFELIPVPMTEKGPDMDVVENHVKDETVKGIWCVPKYSNPQGIVYSDETIERFAALRPAAKDFRIYWDNAYAFHYFEKDVPIKNLLQEAKKYNNEDIVYMFGSTSKITYAGAGISYIMADEKNLKSLMQYAGKQTIGFDKINQYAHYLFFKTPDGVRAHMQKHAAILKPKFEKVLEILDRDGKGLLHWEKPLGGYFISCDLPKGTAKRTVELCKEAGVIFTGAGATYPYKKDPNDSNIRIAPSLPPINELETAMELFCCCAKIAWAETMDI